MINLRHGRTAMQEEELSALIRMTKGAKSYVEIGTLWGGSAITVALNNPSIKVTAIDPMIGYYGAPDRYAQDTTPSRQAFTDNIEAAGVQDRVSLIEKFSDPFPIEDTFDCGFIDGDHSEDMVRKDWNNLKTRCNKIAFHDVSDPAIIVVIQNDVGKDAGWKFIEHTGDLMVFANSAKVKVKRKKVDSVLNVVVGINHWDDLTKPFIDSILTHEPEAQIVVVDNFSDIPYQDERVEIIRSDKRLGYPAAINLVLKGHKFDFAAIFNNDCICHARYLDYIRGCNKFAFYGSSLNAKEKHYQFVWSAWMVFSKYTWKQIGEFDEKMDAGWEDFDYQIRCIDSGYFVDVVVLPIEHLGKSTRFEEPHYLARWEDCRAYYNKKHGMTTRSYDGKHE